METVQQRFNLSFDPLRWFKKPRTQQDIIDKCRGDVWAANKLQNELINCGIIKIDTENHAQFIRYILA